MTRTRFAPSPTGDLHLGGAWTALASWVVARAAGGAFVLRVEDLDQPRVVVGAQKRIEEDLAWLGLDWDEPGGRESGPYAPYRQSERDAFYTAALSELTEAGRTYPCDCSRSEIARVASAPHPGEEVVYPGTCRDRDRGRAFKRAPAIRLRVEERDGGTIVDEVQGTFAQNLIREVGDFVLRRGDGIFAYQLAVAVDDARMQVTHVIRGVDLLGSTPRQALIQRLLGEPVPRYAHLPLVTGSKGERLAKRTRGAVVRDLRAAGVPPEDITGRLAHGLGLTDTPSPRSPHEIVAHVRRRGITWRLEPWPVPEEWAGGLARTRNP